MALDRSWLLATARAEREAMGRSIQYTEPVHWDEPSVSQGWRNRDIVAHLASGDAAAAASEAGEAQQEIEEFMKSLGPGQVASVEAFNDFAVARRANEPLRSVIAEWGNAADLLLARCAQVSPDAWADTKVYWVVGEMRIGYLLQSRVMEWWLHGEDLRAGADLPPRREHPPIYSVNDLAVRLIPYGLSQAGLSFPGKSVLIELEAAGGGIWHYGLAPRESPAPGKVPDAVIDGWGFQFALVAGHRLSPQESLRDGSLRVSGDVGLAETVLANLRAFA